MADHPGKRRWALPLLGVRIKPATDRDDGALGVIRMESPINKGRSRFSRLFYEVPDMTSEVARGASEQGPESAWTSALEVACSRPSGRGGRLAGIPWNGSARATPINNRDASGLSFDHQTLEDSVA